MTDPRLPGRTPREGLGRSLALGKWTFEENRAHSSSENHDCKPKVVSISPFLGVKWEEESQASTGTGHSFLDSVLTTY